MRPPERRTVAITRQNASRPDSGGIQRRQAAKSSCRRHRSPGIIAKRRHGSDLRQQFLLHRQPEVGGCRATHGCGVEYQSRQSAGRRHRGSRRLMSQRRRARAERAYFPPELTANQQNSQRSFLRRLVSGRQYPPYAAGVTQTFAMPLHHQRRQCGVFRTIHTRLKGHPAFQR